MIPLQILEQYNLPEIISIEEISMGLMHGTFRIKTEQGDFIAQKLHAVLTSDAIGNDFLAVTNYLQTTDIVSPKAILNKQDQVLTKLNNEVWRLQTAIPGNSYPIVKSAEMARSAGQLMAKFHRQMANINHDFQSTKILHDTQYFLDKFQRLISENKDSDLYHAVKSELDEVMDIVPKLLLPEGLTTTVVHGDPKISNILFIEDQAVSMVDLDTCNHHTPLVDLGDAMRSWCGNREDDPNNTFRGDIYESAIDGYSKEIAGFLPKEELSLIPQASMLITLELTMRFFNDYFEDNFFGWDSTRYNSRRDHNLARARGQLALYHSQKEFFKK